MENQNMNLPQQPLTVKPKKPWYKKWWIWVIIGVVVFGVIGAVTPKKTTTSENVQSTTAAENEKQGSQNQTISTAVTEASTEKTTAKPTEAATENKDDFINSCQTIDFKTLARNPDKYKDEHFKFTGKVIQVMDSNSWFDDSTTLRVEITKKENQFAEDGYLWDDAIVAKVKIQEGNDRILEDDIIDFYGICDGLYTYKTVLGDNESVPLIDIHYFTIHE